MDPLHLHHRVEYTRNKHSRAIYRGDTIVIRLAGNLSKSEEDEHIQNLLRRMTHIVLQEKKKITIDPFRPLLEGGQFLTVKPANGRLMSFTLTAGERTRARAVQGGWLVTVSPQLRRAALHRFLWSLLARSETAGLTELVARINASTLRVPVSAVRVQFATTQWGSCSSRGVIMLNTALLFLPASALRYVIIHELAHRRIARHSPAYWEVVESVLPDYQTAYDLLKEYRLPQE